MSATTPNVNGRLDHESEDANGLAGALAAFQAENGLTFAKTKTAKVKSQRTGAEYTYKYADLGDILPVVRPLLAKHGLSWSSKPGMNAAGDLVLAFRLLHASGELDAGEMPLGVDKGCKPQELGSAITYARRYALTAQLNLATDEDEDGALATASNGGQNGGHFAPQSDQSGENDHRSQPSAAPVKDSERPASNAQKRMLRGKAAEADLSSVQFANVLMVAKGDQPRETDDEDAAERFLKREIDHLPARLVNAVLDGIGEARGGW